MPQCYDDHTIDPALLAQIRAAPDDMAARLVYADRLLERGDPYGELIALQCTSRRPDDELARRADALLVAHGDAWLARLGLERGEATWSRGFVEHLTLTADRLLELPGLVDHVPLRSLRVRGLDGNAAKLAEVLALPLVRVVKELDLYDNGLDAECLRVLARGPLANLTSLDLRTNAYGADGVHALAGATQLAGLEELALSYSQFLDAPEPGDEGAAALARASHLTKLTSLTLQFWGIGIDGVVALAKAPHLATLQTLRLAGNTVGAEGATAIAERLTALASLDLWGSGLGLAGARTVLALPHLVDLDLGGNELPPAIARAIVDAPNLVGIQQLWLRDNKLGDAGARALSHLPALHTLDLNGNELTHAGVRALAARRPPLAFLDVGSNPLGRRGGEAIAELPMLARLQASSIALGPEGARALAAAPSLSELTARYNALGPDGVHALRPLLSKLSRLDLGSNALTADGVRALRDVPLPRLRYLYLGHNALGAEGAEHLAALELPALRELHLPANQLGAEGALALASAAWLPALDRLVVAPADEITDGLDALRAAAPRLRIAGAERSL